jgi:2-polyprenyl-3-methyl-5-hydroxy-6-metoxy-1,4-benzoquinol methylase
MTGYDYVINPATPTLGGNIWQGDPWTFSPGVWRYMIDRFAVHSVLDVGSGRGHAAHWFHKAGCQVVAMDGEEINIQNSLYPTVKHSVNDGPLKCPVDFVHCQEVAEHISPIYVPWFIDTLCNGAIILMTHAEPGQEGHSHVNCQPSQYWIEKLAARGYTLLPDDTKRVKDIANQERAHHLARSGLVFARKILL